MTITVRSNGFEQQINAAQERFHQLKHQSEQFSEPQNETEIEALEELSTALEELHVAAQEMNQQHEQLMKAQDLVEVERQRYLDLFEFAPNSYLVTNFEGHIQEANQAAITLLGMNRDRLIGRLLVSFVLLEERKIFRTKLNQIQQEHLATQIWEGHFQQYQRELIPCEVTISAIYNSQRQVTGLRWLIRDISERRRIVEMETASRIKDEFLAMVSHELRSPLNPILGWAKILRSHSLDEATTTKALETIDRNASLQAQLIEDLLDVSRILRSAFSLNRLQVNLKEVIEAAIETVELAAEAKGIDLRFVVTDPIVEAGNEGESQESGSQENDSQESEMQPCAALNEAPGEVKTSSPIQILGDPVRLQQIVWNLLSNAIKFTPGGGRVNIELSRVTTKAVKPTLPYSSHSQAYSNLPNLISDVVDYAQIMITDTGRGISPDFLPYVFDYFRQADSSSTRSFGGLGLGLAIVYYLVEAHGGTVRAESEGEGQGAKFTIRLPLLTTFSHSTRKQEISPNIHRDLSGLHVLLVDDDPDTLEMTLFLLEQEGAVVTAVASASEAISVLLHNNCDVLISDIGMPDTDGFTLLSQAQTLLTEQGRKIPAITLTAYAGELNKQQALAAGFELYISKPVEPKALISAIAQVTRGNRP